MKIKIATQTVKAKELLPGDLFSFTSEEYWGSVNDPDNQAVGEKVYIRTNTPCPPDQEEDDLVLVSFSYVNEDLKVGTDLHHQSYHVDVDWDEDGERVLAVSPNPECPYCSGEMVVTECTCAASDMGDGLIVHEDNCPAKPTSSGGAQC